MWQWLRTYGGRDPGRKERFTEPLCLLRAVRTPQWGGIWLSLGYGAAAECSCRSGLAAQCIPQIKSLLLCQFVAERCVVPGHVMTCRAVQQTGRGAAAWCQVIRVCRDIRANMERTSLPEGLDHPGPEVRAMVGKV